MFVPPPQWQKSWILCFLSLPLANQVLFYQPHTKILRLWGLIMIKPLHGRRQLIPGRCWLGALTARDRMASKEKPSYSRQDPHSSPPHSSGQNHIFWSKIFDVWGSFCYGLVSCNLCSYSFVESASERQSPFLAKQLSMCPVPMCPCAHVPMCPCAQPRWRVLYLTFCQTSANKKLERSQRKKEENEQLESDSRALA